MATGIVALAPIEQSVQRMYESFPYPHYPLFGKPVWQDGYAASSKFAGRLFEDLLGQEASINSPTGPFLRHARTILVAGSGEALPYVMRQVEPRHHRLLCVDLSRRSLRRAKFRVGMLNRHTDFVHSDINRYLRQQASVTGPFNHIDAYGVLHHLNNPSVTLRLMGTHLSSNGTMRLMVYNSPARRWIHEIQAAFRILKLDPYVRGDREFARSVLTQMAEHSPSMRHKINCIGKSTMQNDARLVDTFFHAREARLPIERWFELIEMARFTPLAMFDRYGELDDLPNPLWKVPTAEQIVERAADGRFENNLELYLRKQQFNPAPSRRFVAELSTSKWRLIKSMLAKPPRHWFSFEETKDIDFLTRRKIWCHYLRHVAKVPSESSDALIKTLPEPAIARLCRMGAILPCQIKDDGLHRIGSEPISTSTPRPDTYDMANFDALPLKGLIEERLASETHRRPLRLRIVMEHLKRSQVTDMETYKQFG